MLGFHIKDDAVGNDLWLVMEHVTHVTPSLDGKALHVYFSGGGYAVLKDWTTDKWTKFIDKTFRQLQIASAGGMKSV